MKGIRDQLLDGDITRTGMKMSPDFTGSPLLGYETKETGRTQPTISESTEFILSVTIGVAFWANQAQYRDAHKQALETLLNRIFQDQLGWLHEVRQAISDGDRREALQMCDRLERSMLS